MYTKCLIACVLIATALLWCSFFSATPLFAQSRTATTTLTISICGDSIINAGEACDIPGETGVYSTTIVGRQCSTVCQWGPYCGDGILQTSHSEQCDDGNNVSGDFCSADCTVENSAGGGGGSKGGGGGSGGGSTKDMGDTQVSIIGKAYPNSAVSILRDGSVIGTVRANGQADFSFTTGASPGTNSFGFWANDVHGTRSITLNTTFDVTQGAITNISGILLPPSIRVDKPAVKKGETITFSGQSVPSVSIATYIDGPQTIKTSQTSVSGEWSLPYDTSGLTDGQHTAKPKFQILLGDKLTDSNFGQALAFTVGTAPNGTITSSDLNSDSKVNLTDFSILIFWWGGAGGGSKPSADINGNGKVGLEDFSILLFNWTG